MLPPDARVVLGDALRPPVGAIFDRALALTFTLDLESALLVPLAFAAPGARESADPVEIMHAVRSCADRVDIFCQAGHVRVPPRGNDLLALLERMVHQVRRPRPGFLYHPKMWAVRYQGGNGDRLLRLLVLSRNLTADRSWDVCLTLDGVVGSRPWAANRPVFDLIRYSVDHAVTAVEARQRTEILELAEDLRRGEFDYPDGVTEISLYALGIPNTVWPDFSGTRSLVVSPFCNEAGLAATTGTPNTLVGRQEELDRLPAEALAGCDVFVVNELAGIPVGEADGGEVRDILTGLHAKLYVSEQGQRARVLLGSPNATDAAFSGNVELLVELVGGRGRLGIDTMLAPDTGFRAVLAPYERQPAVAVDDAERALADMLRDAAAVPLVATVEEDDAPAEGASLWQIRLRSSEPVPAGAGIRLTAALLTRRGDAAAVTPGAPVEATFGRLTVEDVTPFVVLTAEDDHGARASAVVQASLDGGPPDRLDRLIARQVDSPEKFLRLLALLLGLGTDTALAGDHRTGGRWRFTASTGVFELVVNALADRPGQLDSLGQLVDRLRATGAGRQVLPEGFLQLWDTTAEVRRELAQERAT